MEIISSPLLPSPPKFGRTASRKFDEPYSRNRERFAAAPLDEIEEDIVIERRPDPDPVPLAEAVRKLARARASETQKELDTDFRSAPWHAYQK